MKNLLNKPKARVMRMELAVNPAGIDNNESQRRRLEDSLQSLSAQVRQIDKQLTLQVDTEVWMNFRNQINDLSSAKSSIKEVSFNKKHDKVEGAKQG
ncbi:hypothetical protein ACFOGI_01365 [Virgibacillus xinjiangensis]|uniref:Uncharacterized protein n=1 Tax=Virgibacillus xinjiangensis TaxID=393090 RepID=A0ABV7CR61_9BACI